MMTQMIFAAPMLGLYLLSIVIAWVVGPEALKPATTLPSSTAFAASR